MPKPAVYVLEKMAHGYRRLGRASGGGFYEYPEDGQCGLWSGLKTFERGRRAVADADVADRLLYAQAAEALRCVAEGLTRDRSRVDAWSLVPGGFPASIGGVMDFVDAVGRERFERRAAELAERHGPRFELPADVLATIR